ncbi:hypothetical protein SAMN04488077_1252 [Roseovarius tolerans]|uniref:Uncharacterized protein n=1 Tax=Roseovarius tolerans TaxID=74031 RepID=A0A1H8IQZ2_9RHOB|nr:hypothetical protein [Roseovarius tolerans]SEN70809.1 hypothetical protein SAMN04488077_1252 [Roseovarius tolerans]
MTRLALIATVFGLTLASGASAMNVTLDVPSLWPAEGAFETKRKTQATVTRTQTTTRPAAAPKAVRQDR